jgi:amino acid permease
MAVAIVFNILIDLAIYAACGVFGYLSFLEATKGNLLESFDFRKNHNVMFTGVFCLTIFFTFPMTVFPSRISLDNIIKSLWDWKIKETDPRKIIFKKDSYLDKIHESLWENFPNIRFVLETIVLLGFAYWLAVLFPNVENVLSLTGSTASTMTSYIFPATFYIKATKHGWFHWSTIGAFLVLIYGLVFGTCVTTISILSYFEVIKV